LIYNVYIEYYYVLMNIVVPIKYGTL